MKTFLKMVVQLVNNFSSANANIRLGFKFTRQRHQQIFFDYSNTHSGALLWELYKSAPLETSRLS